MTIATEDRILLAWSGGKDSALALHELQQSARCRVLALLTTVTEGYERVSLHGVREALLDRQAASVGLPLCKVRVPQGADMTAYEAAMREALERYRARGVAAVAFGDLFLEDVRAYRQDKLAEVGLKGIFPLWHRDTPELARRFLGLGFKTVVTCVDAQALDRSFVGRVFDERFLADLPAGVDPCGENGEFHSFVYDGPIFREAVGYELGQTVLREDRFWFCDLVPTQ